MLDFARPIRFDYAPADINALCADVVQAMRSLNQNLSVDIALKLDPSLEAIVTDAERLRTALVNILTNACQAVAARRSEESPPTVGPSFAFPDIEIATAALRDSVRIVIKDRGAGVRTEDLPRVFDPYFTTKRTGSGLGLAIVKNIIEGMGGSIVLDSRAGTGTEIRIDLPARERAHDA